MKRLSFWVPDAQAAEAQRWAYQLGIDRSDLLRDALRRHIVALRGELDVESYERLPITDAEVSLAEVAGWGPAERWDDWAPD